MQIRKFYLINSSGERIGLNGESGIYFTAPTGLGYSLTPTIADLKYGFFKQILTDSEPQNSITGTLTFVGGNPYEKYQNLVNWLAIAGQLQLIYSPASDSEFYRQVEVSYLSKSEKNNVGALEVATSFSCLTQWYRPNATELVLENTEGKTIRYNYRYTESLIYGSDSAATMAGTISPGGHIPGSILFRYYGAISNPIIRITGETSGETIGVCSAAVSISDGEILELSTLYRDSHLYKIQSNNTTVDLLDTLSLTTDPFFHLPTDEPCTIIVESDSDLLGKAELLVYYYYRSV